MPVSTSEMQHGVPRLDTKICIHKRIEGTEETVRFERFCVQPVLNTRGLAEPSLLRTRCQRRIRHGISYPKSVLVNVPSDTPSAGVMGTFIANAAWPNVLVGAIG